ncbi:MAG: hypothetical protein KME28_10075 [Pelatocladus maniniholoensis HA4357-MV3]|jgi:hypothetical protein|uniref:Uncharacterized protein n=1 Tax=Pelatocladus maniniholoensis HA4357-MV3 TaxID=1117104 RepID=A0A9E3H6Z9_9NOST|nr:hypothetical protein [Pelatocladus maniniholoensis HA4357-MV3]BAZ66674.1 hypothetical protein NIES4106_14260 [Fischerella sp. NIES-4106]
MDTQLIKLIEKPILKEVENTEQPEPQNFPNVSVDIEEENFDISYQEPNYISVRDYPVVQSVGNSGWQASDIWRDIRIDNFC